MKIFFAGGGTGGHIFPIVAVAREIKKKEQNIELAYLGPEDDFSSKTFFNEGIKTYFILSGKIRRYLNPLALLQNIFDVFIKIPLGTIQAFLILFFTAPDLIFCKGGYGSLPAAIGGWFLGIPVFLHESDVEPGLANKIISHISPIIFVSFSIQETAYFPAEKMVSVGNPIRPELLQVNLNSAKKEMGIKSNKPILLFLGGSQGSTRINDLILQILSKLLKIFEIIHQTGYKDFETARINVLSFVPKELQNLYHFYPFLTEEQIKYSMALADCVVSRAGAGTIFEIAAFHKPSILIPLPESAQNHQVKNAYAYAKTGAAIVLEEENCTPNFFLEKVVDLYEYGNLELMAKAAEKFSKPEAASKIAQYIIEFLKK
ncbi:MAG TPA: UDP-N-acetylglucosamine--N-acetylmuramyl-(pentapeptide) pyrophosphoryl-undecaprenol N-acetylglucosamine transferase [Candidatus Pacearchaeota archaeon]|nr:UDP-N-acetylglucosamine--N-acetylmuramyl-(pentapeptide) pyrophosphoryl-undecaprenol N-acetylglucosamine transferase [Candidatus Pacearchaeota archaeon]HQH19985.1 UDP-N-acetylglucosamine--N-acetylmuramyl-(pentapeptide) pyrophosphoryl-undecaprenol N-acetylglucosamine transferase [Candidatus Pacearchaeota archaeon]